MKFLQRLIWDRQLSWFGMSRKMYLLQQLKSIGDIRLCTYDKWSIKVCRKVYLLHWVSCWSLDHSYRVFFNLHIILQIIKTNRRRSRHMLWRNCKWDCSNLAEGKEIDSASEDDDCSSSTEDCVLWSKHALSNIGSFKNHFFLQNNVLKTFYTKSNIKDFVFKILFANNKKNYDFFEK